MINNDFEDVVLNRRSIRVFDKDYKIDRIEMEEILKEATKAPSSVNIQSWRFVVVDSEEGKDKLRPLVRFNSTQNDSSSAMIVIFGDMKCYEKIDEIYSSSVSKGYSTEEDKNRSLEFILPYYKSLSKEQMKSAISIDASLVAMQLMLVARAHGYDSNPIGGFDKENIAESFGLDPERYLPVIIIAMGKAAEEGKESTRLEVGEITKFI